MCSFSQVTWILKFFLPQPQRLYKKKIGVINIIINPILAIVCVCRSLNMQRRPYLTKQTKLYNYLCKLSVNI